MIQVNQFIKFLKRKHIPYFPLMRQSTHTCTHIYTHAHVHTHTILGLKYCAETFLPHMQAWEEFSAK